MTWNHLVAVGFGGGGEKGIAVGAEAGDGPREGDVRCSRVLGAVMSGAGGAEAAGGSVGGESSAAERWCEDSVMGSSRSRAKRSGEALRACCAASGVR